MLNPIDPIKITVHKDRILKALKGEVPPPVTVGLDISNFIEKIFINDELHKNFI